MDTRKGEMLGAQMLSMWYNYKLKYCLILPQRDLQEVHAYQIRCSCRNQYGIQQNNLFSFYAATAFYMTADKNM